MAGKTGADSARRALEMLFAFTEQHPHASVRDLADKLDVPVPSVHRYVAMLRDMGLIEEGSRGRYHLTMRVAALGRAARLATPIVDLAEPFMRQLSEELGEAVLLMLMVQGTPVCFSRVETPSRFRLSFDPGQPLPLLRGASVRLLLGSLTPPERQAYVERALADGATPTKHGTEQFLLDVERDVERGWAISNEEIDQGVWAASAAVYEGSRVVAAISVPCPIFRVDDKRCEVLVDRVQNTASDLSQAITPL